MNILVWFGMLFLTTNAFSAEVIGSVTKLRGQVTILELGQQTAKTAVLGQSVGKEASILTSEKSFIQITLLDKSQVNLGPASKMVLGQTPTEKVGLVNLLKGKLRTEVIKESDSSKDKLYIKTRTAAMGVRGTDFQATFNPENKITNLITFRGKVAMVKDESENVKEALSHKETIVVEKGTFAAISDNLKNATEPVKLSPIQYTGLKLNPEMNEEAKISKDVFEAEFQKTVKEYAEISKKEIAQKNTANHTYDVKNQVLRPTAGGVVDLATGIYVPPTVDKNNYIKELNIYELKSDKGQVTQTGEYVAPKGMILDAKKGFIADASEPKAEIIAELKKLNNEISGQLVKPSKPTESDLNKKTDDAYDKYFIKE